MTRLRSEHPPGRGKGTTAGARDVGPLGRAKEKSDPVALTRGNRPIGATSAGAQEGPLLPPSGLLRDRPIRQRALSFHLAPSGLGSDLGIARSAPAAPEAEAPQGRSPRAFTTLLLELLCLPLLCTEAHPQTTTLVSNTGETRSRDLVSPYQKAPP